MILVDFQRERHIRHNLKFFQFLPFGETEQARQEKGMNLSDIVLTNDFWLSFFTFRRKVKMLFP